MAHDEPERVLCFKETDRLLRCPRGGEMYIHNMNFDNFRSSVRLQMAF